MRHSFILTVLVLSIFTSCGSVKKATKVDQGNPSEVAGVSLDYYKLKDLESLKYLSTDRQARIIQRIILSKDESTKKTIFGGWRWEKIQQWDRKIKEVRFADGLKTAYAMFDLPPNAKANTPVSVVLLASEDNKWKFDDIRQYTKAEFEGLGYVMDKSSK